MSNKFSFFGEVLDGSSKRTGYGHIITFTGGWDLKNGWGASTASTLEEITSTGVVWSIKNSGKMTLAIPFDIKLGNHFAFKADSKLPRFTIQIFEDGVKKKDIFFLELGVEGKPVPIQFKNITINGVEQPLEKLSVLQVRMTVPSDSVTVP